MIRSAPLLKLHLWLGGLLVLVIVLSLMAGKIWVPWSAWDTADTRWLIVAELRAPRAVLGAMIGGALGLSGAVMQGYLRNPLADPGLFGVSSCAALGAVAVLFFTSGAASPVAISISALLGAASSMALLGAAAGRDTIEFTLIGLILSSLGGALTALLISLAPTPFASSEIITWLMGAITDRSWSDVALAAPFIVLGAGVLITLGHALDALALGETVARSLGVHLHSVRWRIVLGTGLCVGAAVACAGVIGFVGLMIPHVMRAFVGHRPSALLLPSALAGGILVVVADACVRLLPTVSELRLGVVMSLLGAPFFWMVLISMRRHRP